jgi:chorismate-pyruvate lyase
MPEALSIRRLRMQVFTDSNVLLPLTEFYEDSGLALPEVMLIEGRQMPEPYRSLLVHDSDMTPTLEAAHRQTIHLRVLKYSLSDGVLARQVLLVLEDGATAVEFGGIKIYLEHLPEPARRLVLEKRQPLGTILHNERVAHESHPSAYLRVTADEVMREALDLAETRVLYGRCNVLTDLSQNVLARVVEILPPWRGLPKNGEGKLA